MRAIRSGRIRSASFVRSITWFGALRKTLIPTFVSTDMSRESADRIADFRRRLKDYILHSDMGIGYNEEQIDARIAAMSDKELCEFVEREEGLLGR